jgi:hypothetical protein
MQSGNPRRTATIIGIILLVLGIVSLAYFASPVRLMVLNTSQLKTHWLVPLLGGLALIGGIGLLYISRPRN